MKYGCFPKDESAPGSEHVLVANSVGEREFYWTGDGWATNKNLQWQTDPVRMMALGWKYLCPAVSKEQKGSHE